MQLPLDRDGFWEEALGSVASLIFKLPRNFENSPVLPKRAPELCARAHSNILADSKRPLEDGHALISGTPEELTETVALVEATGRRMLAREVDVPIYHGRIDSVLFSEAIIAALDRTDGGR